MWFKDKWYSYFKSFYKSSNIQFNSNCWSKALKLNEKGDYKLSFLEVLKYIDSKIKKYEVSENIFKIPHWSVFLDIDFSWDFIKISSDFLDVSEANKIPLFRRVAELSFSWLILTQIKLIDNKLKFDFSCHIDLYDPYKIFDVLWEICYFSDKYDEEFCEQFWAKNISIINVKEIPIERKEKIWLSFQEIISSNFEIIKDLEERRKNNYAWDVISTTYKMIDYVCSPKWSLALRIFEKVSELYSRDISLETVIFRWKEFLREISAMPKEDFFKSIYDVNEFIPNRKVVNAEFIAEYLKPGYNDAYRDLQSWDIESAYVIFMHILYNSMYYHIMPYWMEKAIVSVIKRYSNIPVNKNTVTNLSNSIFSIINLQNIPSNYSWFFGFIWWALISAFVFIFSSIFGW